MSWRIKKIEIENFKFFKDTFLLDIDSKNLLLYGENGSGKSSLYWSFFTHFQAYSKSEEQAKKYFIPDHNENLRNRYSNSTDDSGIKVTFDNGAGTINEVTDSLTSYYSADSNTHNFMRLTVMSSDFMNYKFLSSLFDFYNSEENEVFYLFEKEVLPFIDLDQSFKYIDGTESGINNSGGWWHYIKEVPNILPKNKKNYNSFNQRAQQYKDYLLLINQFNELMCDALIMIEGAANALLRDVFKLDARVVIEYNKATFNKRLGRRSRDGILHNPKIYLHAKIDAPNIVDTSTIKHPKSFFNEAKITCMALAIRLAVLDRHPAVSQSSPTLFIDDLLISLDMSFRKQVIKILLNYTQNYQLLIFTHDRAFFHMIWAEIESRKKHKEWKKYEIYTSIINGREQPQLINSKTYLEEAKMHLDSLHIPASANAARRLCEQQLKRLLPLNMQLKTNSDDFEKVFCDLNGLIDNYKKFIGKFGFPNIAPSLHDSRRYILNPFSHDDIETPLYRDELEKLIKELEELTKVRKNLLVGDLSIHVKQYSLRVNNGAHTRQVNFVFLERYEKLEYGGNEYFGNPRVRVKSSDWDIACREYELRALFRITYNALSYNATTAPKLTDCLFDNGTNALFAM